MRSCEVKDCSDGDLNGVWFDNINDLVPNRYFQYRAVFESDDLNRSLGLKKVVAGETRYTKTSPYIVTKDGVEFKELSNAIEGPGEKGGPGGIKYNLGFGGDWYYHNGNSWAQSSGNDSIANSLSELNLSMKSFAKEVGQGRVYLKAFLRSDGATPCELKTFELSGNL